MKKLIFVLLAAAAISCGDRSNRSSERENNDGDNTETVEPDTTGMESEAPGVESDTTSRQQQSDTLNNK